ncbi:MAG TPA: hypothetical protein VHL11_03640 [Phototrophicaceae bacterium]|jgi:hypothetical protein|nr:hypothetical protein [Phototrophicaceae bacterium]
MWDKVIDSLPQYPSAVLTGLNPEGYPFSLRCTPQLDSDRQALRLALPNHLPLCPGPAGLLFHYHDEQLWNLKNFVLRGRLEQTDAGWLFYPTQYIEGATGRPTSLFRLIRDGRRAAKQYLTKRQLPRPRVPWTQLKEIYSRAQQR